MNTVPKLSYHHSTYQNARNLEKANTDIVRSPAVYLLNPEEQVKNLNLYISNGYTVFGVGAQPALITIDDDVLRPPGRGPKLVTISKSGNHHIYRFSPLTQYDTSVEALVFGSDPVREAYNILRRHRSIKLLGHPQALDAAMVETPEEAERVKEFLTTHGFDKVEIYDRKRLIKFPDDYC